MVVCPCYQERSPIRNWSTLLSRKFQRPIFDQQGTDEREIFFYGLTVTRCSLVTRYYLELNLQSARDILLRWSPLRPKERIIPRKKVEMV